MSEAPPYRDGIAPFLKNASSTGSAVLLWLWTEASSDYDGALVFVTVPGVASALGLSQRSIARTFAELESLGAMSSERSSNRCARALHFATRASVSVQE